MTPITAVSASADGQLFASVSEDMTAKVFDVVNFGESLFSCANANMNNYTHVLADMINIIKLGFKPHSCCWVHKRGQAQALLAVYENPFFIIKKILTVI